MLRRPAQLARRDLESIVDALQQALYLDDGADGSFIWNPDKTWDGADICDAMVGRLSQLGLTPTAIEAIH